MTGPLLTDSRQIKKRQALSKLGTPAVSTLETILDKVNLESDSPLRMSATFPVADAKLNFSASKVTMADGASKSVPALKSQVFTLAASTVDFQTQATTGATFAVAWPTSTVGQYRRAGFTLLSSGVIQVLFSAENAVLGSLVNPGTLFIKSGIALGYIDLECTHVSGLFKTAGSVTNIIENLKISRFSSGSGGSGSGSSALGSDLVDLLYKASLLEIFDNAPDGTTPIDITSGKTDSSLHDSSNELFRLSYDASRTVTGTGTSMTLSATPSFTVKTGDVMIVGSEVRKLTVLTQTTYTLESAFTVDPTAAACCVSQAVHTVDLNNFNNGGLGLSAASQFSASLSEALVAYDDTETLGDIIPNYGQAPVIAYSASTDATSWTTSRVRVTSLESSEGVVSFPTTNPNLYVRFFANKTSGTGAVNLLGFEVAFHSRVGQVAGAQYYTAFARPTSSIAQNCSIGLVSGKTRFTFTFPYTRGLNSTEASGSVLEVIANGQIIPRFTSGVTDSAQAYFVEINDNTIEMDTDYSASGIDFQFKVQRVGIIDNNSQNTSKIALHDDLLDQSIDAQVVPTFRTAVNGAPTSSQFRSDITGRASIPDLSSMLSVQMGPQRMMTQEIYQLQNEFGPAGQPVFGAVNDKFNQIRFVGTWITYNDTNGPRVETSALNDYIEFVFYGTGVNLNTYLSGTNRDVRISIDGGSEIANIFPTSASGVLTARNYSQNIVLNAVSGLSLGLHTIKIRNNTTSLAMYGFEVLTETTSLRIAPGTVMKGKYKNSLSAPQTVAYDSSFESGTLGTRGGCVLVYLKNDGTIGKAVTPTDISPGYLTGASHTNEEVVRAHNFREFGCGRADDFSSLVASTSDRAFTLDDGVTSLVGKSIQSDSTVGNGVYLSVTVGTSFLTLTFVGTGLDVMMSGGAAGTWLNTTVFVDGVSQGIITGTGTAKVAVKICSGLPYGTHTVKLLPSSGGAVNTVASDFLVYAPKKPALPTGAIELAQYYKTANYIANSTLDNLSISQGTIRKSALREMVYVGTWDLGNVGTQFSQYYLLQATATGSYAECTFYGTGFDFRFSVFNTNNATAVTVSVDGNTNLSSYTTSFYGGQAFTASTGVLNQAPASGSTADGGLSVSGLSLGKHTIRFTFTSGGTAMRISAVDVISPIHAPAINGPYVVQNTLALGNNGLLDLRTFNKKDVPLANVGFVCQAFGVSNSPGTASTIFLPAPDLSCIGKFTKGRIRVSYSITFSNTNATNDNAFVVYVDGVLKGIDKTQAVGVANNSSNIADSFIINITPGFHKIDVYYKASGASLTLLGFRRVFTVEEISGDL